MTTSIIKTLRQLRNSSESLWNTAVATAGIVGCGERYDARREREAAGARDSALADWNAAIAAAEAGDYAAALDDLEGACSLALEWGDDSAELKAIELLRGMAASSDESATA